jgi:ribosomal protein S18 acetylase RimI-like enzyme
VLEILLRSIVPDDDRFLYKLYRDNHRSAFECLGPELCKSLLKQQNIIQESQYRDQYPELEGFIILSNQIPVGKLYLNRDEKKTVLVNIEISPVQQKKGIGKAILGNLIRESEANHRPIRLHVAHDKTAVLEWYLKLGFRRIAEKDLYIEMEFRAI